MEYHSKYTGAEVDALLGKVESGDVGGKVTVDSALSTESENPVQNKVVTTELGKKADTDGVYPQMSVGKADDLSGRGESIPAEFTFRATGGKSIKDGAATIKELLGNAVVWNQKYDISQTGVNGSTLSFDGRDITAINAGNDGYFGITIYTKIIKAHRYAVLGRATRHNNDSYAITLGNAIIGTLLQPESASSSFGVVLIADSDSGSIYLNGITRISNASFTISDLQVIDLTQMFQAGNEPTTIEEYNARKPIVADEYAFNEGEVIAFNGDAIKSVGDNAWDEQWEIGAIDNNTGTITPSNSHIRSKNYIKVISGET